VSIIEPPSRSSRTVPAFAIAPPLSVSPRPGGDRRFRPPSDWAGYPRASTDRCL